MAAGMEASATRGGSPCRLERASDERAWRAQELATGLTRIVAVGLSCGGGGGEALSEDTVRDWFRLKMLLQARVPALTPLLHARM